MSLRSLVLMASCCMCAFGASAQDRIAEWMNDGTILVCKAGQCVQTNYNMSREYLANQLTALTNANVGKDIDICEGNTATRQCVQRGISFPVQSPTIQTTVTMPKARLIDSRPIADVSGMDLVVDYKVRAGDTFPHCQTALSRIGTVHAGSSEMMSPKFNCKLTETGSTLLSLAYHIDFIDFDNGIIGAMYTAAADNVLTGIGHGYVLLDFANGVKMDGDETFPYPEQLAALQSGEVATFNTAGDMEAVWMKPTPFLNLVTPDFAPNNCNTFVGGCSAQMLNNPALAVPPAQAKLNRLTPSNVVSTTGLIQQHIALEPASSAEYKTVKSKRAVTENGRVVYREQETRHFVRENGSAEMVEDKSKAEKVSSGNTTVPIETVMENAQKEYAAMKQFEATTNYAGQPVVQTKVEVVAPNGSVLSTAEREYIKQLTIGQNIMVDGQNVQVPAPVVQPSYMPQNPIPVNVNQRRVVPASQPVTITPEKKTVKEEIKSYWKDFRKAVNKYLYF